MDLAEISLEMAKISSDLKNFVGKCSISQFGRVSSGFREKTRQPTHSFRVLKSETHPRLSPASGRPVLESGRMGWMGQSGFNICWTPLYIPIYTTVSH